MNAQIAAYLPIIRAEARRSLPRMKHQLCFGDLVSIGMVATWNAIRTFDDSRGCSLNTYVNRMIRYAMAREVSTMHFPIRRVALFHASIHPTSDDELGIDLPSDAKLQDELLRTAVAVHALAGALTKLPRKLRDVVHERHFNDRTFEEIGADSGISKQAVKQREQKALERLRIALERSM